MKDINPPTKRRPKYPPVLPERKEPSAIRWIIFFFTIIIVIILLQIR